MANIITAEGRKVSSDIENPIDNILIEISDMLSPTFKSLGFTPNGLTTISLIFGAASLYHLYNHELTEFTVYAALAYLFDVMDGFYARKYNMVTVQGDKYDHYKDVIMVLIGILIVFKQYDVTNYPVLIVIAIVLLILGLINTGCQEKIKSDSSIQEQEEVLRILDPIVPDEENCSYYMKYLRYFGTGTLVFLGICTMWYLDKFAGKEKPMSNVIDINNLFMNPYNEGGTSMRDIGKTVTECNKWSIRQFLESHTDS